MKFIIRILFNEEIAKLIQSFLDNNESASGDI